MSIRRILAIILGRRDKVAQSTIPAEIRGALAQIYDERGYERDPVKVTVYVGKKKA